MNTFIHKQANMVLRRDQRRMVGFTKLGVLFVMLSPYPIALQDEHRMFPTESPAVDRARMGLNIHNSKPPNKAVLATIQLASEVSYLLSKVS